MWLYRLTGLGHLKKARAVCFVAYGKYCTRFMSVSYVCGFNLMKSEYHKISTVEVPLVKMEWV